MGEANGQPGQPPNEESSSFHQKPALHPRIARAKLADARDFQAFLEFARRARLRLDGDVAQLDQLLADCRRWLDRYTALAEGRIEGRRRPIQRPWGEDDPPRPQFLLFLDECGSHQVNPQGDRFPAFGLCGVIVDEERYPSFDRSWRRWKAEWLGSPRTVVHEPEVRGREGRFFRAALEDQQRLMEALATQLMGMDFTVIAAVIQKLDFASVYGQEKVDDFLPPSQYLMCLDFVIERFVHFLYYTGGDARGVVYAESRGALEDAQVQHEYVRLRIEGTQFQSASWFRYQLAPFVEFLPKRLNNSGLQVADLAARPCAEKVLRPESDPERWDIVRGKLYDGGAGRPESYGLKSFPTASARMIFGLG